PAGMEMRERKMGTNRPTSTVHRPFRSNQASVLSTSETLTSGSQFMMARVRSRPSSAPTPYSRYAPTTDPIVHQTTASRRPNELPREAVNPASGSMISLGMGGKRFSNATMIAAPSPPSDSMTPTDQPVSPPRSSLPGTGADVGARGESEAAAWAREIVTSP